MVSKTVKLTENQEKELLDIAELNLGDRNFGIRQVVDRKIKECKTLENDKQIS